MPTDTLPTKYVLSRRPKEYLKHGLSHCGAYSVKAILSAYGKDMHYHPREYHPTWIGKVTGISWSKSSWVDVLALYGLRSNFGSATTLSDREKINLLKTQLSRNTPLMVCIGNGYLSDGRYKRLRALLIGNWITLWGYDDAKKIFYVYDSCVPPNRYESGIPIGNTVRTYKQMLRDWKGSITNKLLFWLRFPPYFYIAVS